MNCYRMSSEIQVLSKAAWWLIMYNSARINIDINIAHHIDKNYENTLETKTQSVCKH